MARTEQTATAECRRTEARRFLDDVIERMDNGEHIGARERMAAIEAVMAFFEPCTRCEPRCRNQKHIRTSTAAAMVELQELWPRLATMAFEEGAHRIRT